MKDNHIMTYEKMTYGKAIDTIEHIEERTDEEIALAIYRILNMPTIMAVNKDNLVKIIRHLFDKCYEVEEYDLPTEKGGVTE